MTATATTARIALTFATEDHALTVRTREVLRSLGHTGAWTTKTVGGETSGPRYLLTVVNLNPAGLVTDFGDLARIVNAACDGRLWGWSVR